MTIAWRSTMAIGDAGIDADHQRLIELINTVEMTVFASAGNAEISASLDQLVTYTNEHFEREENLMRCTSYNGLIHHRQSHRDLCLQLKKIRAEIETAEAKALSTDEIEQLVVLLRHWLLDHVFKEDMLLKPFLKSLE